MLKIFGAETFAFLWIQTLLRFYYYHWESKILIRESRMTRQPKRLRHVIGLRKVQRVPGILRISIFVTSGCGKNSSSPLFNLLLLHVPRLKLICKSWVIVAIRKPQWFEYTAVGSMPPEINTHLPVPCLLTMCWISSWDEYWYDQNENSMISYYLNILSFILGAFIIILIILFRAWSSWIFLLIFLLFFCLCFVCVSYSFKGTQLDTVGLPELKNDYFHYS